MKKIGLLAMLLVLCLSFTTVFAEEYELKIDFSYGEYGWSPMGSAIFYVTNDDAKVGSVSLAVVGRTQSWEGTIFALTDVLTDGGVYDISLWIKAIDADPDAEAWLTCVTDTLDGDAKYSRLSDPVAINANEWTELVVKDFEFNMEGNASIAFYIEVDDPTAAYFVDDVTIKGDKPINF